MKLRVWRVLNGYSQQEIADMADAKYKNTVSRWEREPTDPVFRFPRPPQFVRIRQFTNKLVDAEDFMRPWSGEDQAQLEAALAARADISVTA